MSAARFLTHGRNDQSCITLHLSPSSCPSASSLVLLSTFFPFSMPVCVTLSRVLPVPLLAFSLHFGDSNVKTHQLYPEQVSVPPGSTTWLCEHKGKCLAEAAATSSLPKTMTLKPRSAPDRLLQGHKLN